MIFVIWKYNTTSATFQRRWSFVKGIAEHGVNVDCYFLLSTKERYSGEDNRIKCYYVADKYKHKNKIIQLLYALFFILKKINKNEFVFFESTVLFPLFVFSLKRIKLLMEYTEYPPLIFSNTRFGVIFKRLFLWIVKNRVTKLFVISEGLKEYFISQGVARDKICVLNMTVDLKRFENVEKQKTERYIAYCGTVSNYKDGVDVLLEAFAIVAKKHKDVKLYILGNTPYKEDKEKNERIIRDNNLEERVFMPGMIPGVLMPQYLKNAEILALARPDNIQAKYGFPTKLGEYLLTANPVVLTRVGEMDRFLVDGESCLFAEPDNAEDFANKLLWALENGDAARKIGENGCVVAKQSFNYFIESSKIFEVIKKL